MYVGGSPRGRHARTWRIGDGVSPKNVFKVIGSFLSLPKQPRLEVIETVEPLIHNDTFESFEDELLGRSKRSMC